VTATAEYLFAKTDEMLALLAEWVNCDSPTPDREAVNVMGDLLAQAFRNAGATVEKLPQREVGDQLLATWGEGPGQILLLCHFDTVWPLGEAARRPFKITGERAVGPGIYDMRGGIVVGLYALKALRAVEFTPSRRLVFLLTSDEEMGSRASRERIEEEARRSDYVLVLEPSRQGGVTTARKGVGRFSLKVSGRAAHSGVEPQKGVNALEELAHQILRLQRMNDFRRGVTVSVGLADGGSRVNVVPAEAWAEIDLRVPTREDGERMTQAILGLTPVLKGAGLEVSGGVVRPPWAPTPEDQALYQRARQVGERLGMEVEETTSGGGSDANFTAALGVPTLDGLGVAGGGAHSVDEWIEIDSLPRRAALLAELIMELQGRGGLW
jgi:glutamate carboxypeptidase